MAKWLRLKIWRQILISPFSVHLLSMFSQKSQPNIALPTCNIDILKQPSTAFSHKWVKLKSVKKWQSGRGSKSGFKYWFHHLWQPMYDFVPQAVCHFLTFFSLVCICGNVLKRGLSINKSHVGAAIFGSGVCKNMLKSTKMAPRPLMWRVSCFCVC